MSREPFRFKPIYGGSINEKNCKASVGRGRGGVGQCSRKPIKGTDWCDSHTKIETAEDADVLWGVSSSNEGLSLISVKILKETKKQILLAERKAPFDYHERIPKDDGKPRLGYRSRFEAAQAYAWRHARRLKNAEEALKQAEEEKHEADLLLLKISDEEQE